MSLFAQVNLVCPNCGASMSMEAARSVNADRRPDLRAAILEDQFQRANCGACSEVFRLQPEFNYIDTSAGLWIACYPASAIASYAATEGDVANLFATTYGSAAPEAAQEIGESLEVRMTFGWPALREKILVKQSGLDDTTLEMLKLDMLRRLPKAPLAQGVELRLTDTTDAKLRFAWLDAASEGVKQEVEVDRALYQKIADNLEAWKPIRDQLANGAFVDIQKLYTAAPG